MFKQLEKYKEKSRSDFSPVSSAVSRHKRIMDQISSEELQQRNVVTVRLFTHMFRAFQRKREIYHKSRKSNFKEIAGFLPPYHVIM
ncbi:unnamed protein product [Parnassius apollo]|uniref:(apollo) hypothetical protein n=1 Tax=Parnassius apollo TaxID=110799 RepID=A0A8S3Y0C1_PARAO|nr:unnamed protein product [Parnassius apollo]